METVQLQCGGCLKLMAIGLEHLGSQVQCPHCGSIVQTQTSMPAEPSDTSANWIEQAAVDNLQPQQDSIFTDPASKVELHTSAFPPHPPLDSTPSNESPVKDSQADSVLATFQPKRVYDKSIVSISLLIFLIPYAILTTGVIIYLLVAGTPRSDPFEYMRDPVKKDGPKRVQHPHNERLAAHLRTTLGQPIQAGDLRVTFQKVRLTADGDLQLVLRVKNTSADTTFEPINDFYVKVDHTRKDSKPYTFLESRSKDGVDTVYNMYLGFIKDAPGNEAQSSAKLHPSEEATIALTTDFPYRKKHIASIVKSNDDYTWRVQVRRGFVRVDGKDVSATMVIGLDFSSRDIEKPKT